MSDIRSGAARREDHERFDELAVGWALHALEPEDETLFAAHLPQCPRCAGTVAETSELMAALATDLPAAEPSAQLRERLHAAVEGTEQVVASPRPAEPADAVDTAPLRGGPAAGRDADRTASGFPGYRSPAPAPRPPAPTWRRVLPNALVAAAVAAILALGTWNVVLSADRDEARATAAAQAEIVDALLAPGEATIAPLTDDDGTAVATVVARDGQVQVVTHGLSVNDRADTVYVVWGIDQDSTLPLGTFDVDGPQIELKTVGSGPTGLDEFSSYGISIEPGRQAPSQPTEVVATGQVTS